MKKYIISSMLLFGVFIAFNNCSKEDVTYKSTIFLWWDEDTEDNFLVDEIQNLTVSIDGLLSGNFLDADVIHFSTTDLSCDNPSNMYKKEISMASSADKTITIRVTDQTGYVVYNETQVVRDGICHFYKIIY